MARAARRATKNRIQANLADSESNRYFLAADYWSLGRHLAETGDLQQARTRWRRPWPLAHVGHKLLHYEKSLLSPLSPRYRYTYSGSVRWPVLK